jgi:glycosyltransferase involved in cell wall biosynthesis
MQQLNNISESLKVLFVSTSYPADRKDWKGRFTANLVEAISRQKEIDLRIWTPPGDIPPSVKNVSTCSEADWLKKMLKTGGIAHIIRTRGIFGAFTVFRLMRGLRHVYTREADADMVHVNWLQNCLPLWGKKTPAVISVLGSDYRMLKLPSMRLFLRSVLRQRPPIIAPNAGWMVPVLEKSFGDIAEIRPIPFGVDERWFRLQGNVPKNNKTHWITVTRITYKKIGNLFKWGKGLFGEDHILHLFGPMQETLSLPEWVAYHGPVSPDELWAKWFPLCSGLITLSQHDEGRPQVMLEAMAAGLPVIASDMPAHLDIIKHGENGWIVSEAQDLKEAISFFNTREAFSRVGESARSWVLKNIGTWDDCAGRYITAYQDLLERNR